MKKKHPFALNSDNKVTGFRSFLELVLWWFGVKGWKNGDVNNLKSLSAIRKKGAVPLRRGRFNCIKVIRYQMSEQKKRKRLSFREK